MARLVRINSLGLVNVHKFQHVTTGEIVRVECSDQEYADLGLKGAGPPPSKSWPTPSRNYRWIGSVGGADKFAAGKYMPDPGEMYVRDGKIRIKPPFVNTKMLILDPAQYTITGDVLSRDTTITVIPDPEGYRIVAGEMTTR